MNKQTRNAVAVAAVVVAAIAFWLVLIAPKKDRADGLSAQVGKAEASLVAAKRQAEAGLAAKRNFPTNYQRLVLLGKAVPAEADTASLLVQLNDIGAHHRTPLIGIKLANPEGEEGEAETEVASLPPLGSGPGPGGLRMLGYNLRFKGGFFDTADFIEGVNSQVRTTKGHVLANGRLMTFDRFVMAASKTTLNPKELEVRFFATAYATPSGQGLTAGATPAGPASE